MGSGMIKGISALFLLITIAGIVSAGERSLDNADARKVSHMPWGNSTVPPVVTEKYKYYEICGCCEKELQGELNQKCIRWSDGKKYDSVTNWKLKWDYGHSQASGACAVDSFTVTVDITFHVPKWVRTDDAPQPLVEKWNSYLEKLMMHEKGHRDRAVEAANELTRAVAALPPARTCGELDREVQTLGLAQRSKLLQDQKDYDDATKHGAQQGAVFP
jgi:predicted secreted Zn-dependent protease